MSINEQVENVQAEALSTTSIQITWDQFAKTDLAVTSIDPTSGDEGGGTSVTITGAGFLDSATVEIGGSAATNVTVVSSTEITCDTPAGSGTVDVVVTQGGDSETLTDGFEYTAPPANVTWHEGDQVETHSSTFGTSHSTDAPANISEGDLIVVVYAGSRPVGTPASGFTEALHAYGGINDSFAVDFQVFWKIATGSEPSSYTFTTTHNTRARLVAGRVTGHDEADPIGNTSVESSGGSQQSSPITISGISIEAGSLLMAGASTRNTRSITVPAEMSEIWKFAGTEGGFTGGSVAGALEEDRSAGATGDRSFTFGSNDQVSGAMWEIRSG